MMGDIPRWVVVLWWALLVIGAATMVGLLYDLILWLWTDPGETDEPDGDD